MFSFSFTCFGSGVAVPVQVMRVIHFYHLLNTYVKTVLAVLIFVLLRAGEAWQWFILLTHQFNALTMWLDICLPNIADGDRDIVWTASVFCLLCPCLLIIKLVKQQVHPFSSSHRSMGKTSPCSCGSVVEHCVSSAKLVGSIPREHTYWQ